MRKKIFITILFILLFSAAGAVPAAGQHYVGVRGGYGLGIDAGFSGYYQIPAMRTTSVWGLWSGGLVWKYYSPNEHYGKVEKHFAGISMEVEFLQKAYEFYLLAPGSGIEYSDRSYRRYFNSIHIPIIWQPHINMAGNRFRIFFNAGVWVSYNLPTGSRVEYYEAGKFTGESYEYKFNLIRDNPFGYGLCGGLGFDLALGDRWTISLEGRYYHSFGDILRANDKYPTEPIEAGDGYDPTFIIRNPWRSPPGNINLSVSLLYRLTDGDYNPRPTKRALMREEERIKAELEERLRQQEAQALEKALLEKRAEALLQEIQQREAEKLLQNDILESEAGELLQEEWIPAESVRQQLPQEVMRPAAQQPEQEAQILDATDLNSEEYGDDQTTESSAPDTEGH